MENTETGMSADAAVIRGGKSAESVTVKNYYTVECVGEDGAVKWVEEFGNLVVDTGLNDLLDKYLKGSTYTAAWYVGLTDASPSTAAGDTLASAAWSEVVPYSDGTRPALTLGTVAAKSVDNSASKASFTINATESVGGAFVAASSTKSETASMLYSVGAFAADKPVSDGDTLNVTVTLTTAAS